MCAMLIPYQLKTSELDFTYHPDHRSSIFTCARAKFTWLEQSELGFFPALESSQRTRDFFPWALV